MALEHFKTCFTEYMVDVDFQKKKETCNKSIVFLSEDLITFPNRVDPDEIQHYNVFHLGLHCLHKHLFNPYTPSVLFVGHWQTVQNQTRRRVIAASDQVLHCLLTECSIKML